MITDTNKNNLLTKRNAPNTATLDTGYFADVATIDPHAPWLQHVPAFARNLESYQQQSASNQLADIFNSMLAEHSSHYASKLTTATGLPLQFIAQSVLDKLNDTENSDSTVSHTSSKAYESFIAETGCIPTRNNAHDFFNAWVWLTFPKTKAILNKYQAQQIARDGISGSRGRVRDAITVLDENGAILVTADDGVAAALKNFDWQHALITPRDSWDNPITSEMSSNLAKATTTSMLMICGHALMEQLVTPRKSLCSHTFIITVPQSFFDLPMVERVAVVDDILAEKVAIWLTQDDVTPRQLSPLPILGVPNYWAENADVSFYADTQVFRSGRRKK